MHVCNYCNRILKNDYEKCPGCGGSSFKSKAYLGEEIIKTPPKDGYKINKINYEKELQKYKMVSTIGIIIIVCSILFSLPLILIGILFKEMFFITFLFDFFPLIIGIAFILTGSTNIKKVKVNLEKAELLSKNGILIKNMPYKAAASGNGHCIKVIYKNSAGVEIPLYSEKKYDFEKRSQEDDTADLLIDQNDYSNYFIDFEIY